MRFLLVFLLICAAATPAQAQCYGRDAATCNAAVAAATGPVFLNITTAPISSNRFRREPDTIEMQCRDSHSVITTSYVEIPEIIRQMSNFCLQVETANLVPAGTNYKVTRQAGQYCRNYQHVVTEGATKNIIEGTACQQADGTWDLNSP